MTAAVTRWRRALEALVGVPFTDGNRVGILRNGDEIFPAMLDAIATSEHTVDLATYVYWTGDIATRFADTLADKGCDGVRVRTLLDAVGAMPMNRDLVARMEEAGCEVEFFREPVTKPDRINQRTHRKLLVCDGSSGFTGGVGIAEEWEGDARGPTEWRDTHVRVDGPAVDGLRAAFASNWAETGRPLFDESDRFDPVPAEGETPVMVVASSSQPGWDGLSSMLDALVGLARESIRVTSAYFVPDDRFVERLCGAASRGVDVQVLVPGQHHDKRVVQIAGMATYETLLDAGVDLWHYERSMLHAKVITVDGVVATIGSANIDERSKRQNEEANVVLLGADLVGELDGHFDDDLGASQRIDAQRWEDRSVVRNAAEAVTGVFREQL